ncbi:MAG TPA: TIM barrel protein, partial [Candidatus Omnitrophota bacterium]|nr:TIM barrel protein [Candidatus Omnitrophota bacterium]
MRLLGAHMSIAGGLDKAVDRGNLIGCTAIQIFVKNNNQWFGKTPGKDEVELFDKKRNMFVFAHTGYLINLASSNPDNMEKSIKSMRQELELAEMFGLPFTVLHPGSHLGQGEEKGLELVAKNINKLFKDTSGYKVKV